jgi:Leucine-rich repeat (LRR) protein
MNHFNGSSWYKRIYQLQHLEEHFLSCDCYRLKELLMQFHEGIKLFQVVLLMIASRFTNALSESNFLRALGCGSTLYNLNLSGSGIVTLPRCIESFVGLKFLNLNECKQLREILGLPPNVEKVKLMGVCHWKYF